MCKYILLFFVVLFACFQTNKDIESILSSDIEVLVGIVDDYVYYDNYLKITLNSKEKVIVGYTFDIDSNISINYGDVIEVKGYMQLLYSTKNFNIFNYQKYMNDKGIFYNFVSSDIEIISNNSNVFYGIKNFIYKRIEKIKLSNAYVKTFIIGDKTDIDDDVMNSYQTNGIVHLFSISGMHIGLFVAILSIILHKLKYKNLIIGSFLLLYMIITNFAVGVIRSSLMYILITINKKLGNKLKSVDILLLLATVLILYNNYYIYDVGFLFSFVITYYLIISNQIFSKCNNYFIKLLMISFISNLASLPILLYNFNSINLISIFINIIFVPLVSFLIFPLSLIVFITNLNFLDTILFYLISFMELLSDVLMDYSIVLNFSSGNLILIFIYYLIISFLIFSYKKNNYKVSILLIILMIFHYNIRYFEKNSEIVFLDVGQGDCILIKYKYNQGVILVDTGGVWNYDLATNVIIPYLDSLGIRKIDYLVLSHGDFDHMGSALSLVNNFQVDNVLMNSYSNNSLELTLLSNYSNVEMINSKSFYSLNENQFIIYNYPSSDENSDSLIGLFYIDDVTFLSTGDAGIEQEMQLLLEDEMNKIDILKVGHHGSITSSSIKFINAIDLKYSVISVGLNNRYNHPVDTVLDNLSNSMIYRTDLNGAIKFIINKKIVSIKTF